MEVTVYGATRNLHSGHYGNWAPDTPLVLAELLSSMKDPYTGDVRIPGWYDSVDPLGEEEQAALEALPPVDEQLKAEMGLGWTEGAPTTLPERLLVPALTIRGLSAGNTGALARNVIPNTATAALGIRLVKGNDPAEMRELVVRASTSFGKTRTWRPASGTRRSQRSPVEAATPLLGPPWPTLTSSR